MCEEYIKDYYLKLKLLQQTTSKQIWLLRNTLDSETAVAKIQTVYQNGKRNQRNVLHEGKFLQATQGHLGIPFLHWAGKQESVSLSIIIVQRLGYTLQERLAQLGGTFSTKTVCQLGIAMLKILQSYHEKGYVVGNIKLNSFQLGRGSQADKLYVNDLMQSASYIKKGSHVPKELAKQRVPIHQFMSYNRLAGYEPSRRDDVESVILLLVYFRRGKLPWTKLFQRFHQKQRMFESDEGLDLKDASMSKEETKEDTLKFHKKLHAIEENFTEKLKCISKYEETSIEEISEGVGGEFKAMLQRCRKWQFQDKPDYNYLTRNLRRLMAGQDIEEDGVYDWTLGKGSLLLSKEKHLQSLKFELGDEQQTLKLCYLPFCQKVEIN